MSLRVKALVVHTCPSRFLRVVTKSRARPQLLFACDACTGVFFFSSAQPENPKENSYVVASNHLTRFSSSYELCGCTNGFFLYVSKMILIGNELQLYVPLMCNPSTGQFITLPKLKSGKSCGVESYLGYEPVANELKVFSMEWSRVSGEVISVEHQVLNTEKQEVVMEVYPMLHVSGYASAVLFTTQLHPTVIP